MVLPIQSRSEYIIINILFKRAIASIVFGFMQSQNSISDIHFIHVWKTILWCWCLCIKNRHVVYAFDITTHLYLYCTCEYSKFIYITRLSTNCQRNVVQYTKLIQLYYRYISDGFHICPIAFIYPINVWGRIMYHRKTVIKLLPLWTSAEWSESELVGWPVGRLLRMCADALTSFDLQCSVISTLHYVGKK